MSKQSKLEKQLQDGIDAILGEKGLAIREKNGGDRKFVHNPQQYQYALRVASGFSRFDKKSGKTSISMLQAATGTGKTLGYLVPLMLYAAYTGKRVAVSTFTRHLQHQIIDNDAVKAARWVKEISGVDISVGRRIGKSNYVSPIDCARLIDRLKKQDAKRYAEAIDFVTDLMEWTEDDSPESNHSGVLDDYLAELCVDVLPDGVSRKNVTFQHGSVDLDTEDMAYRRDVALSKTADVLIVNHALMIMHAFRWSAKMLDDEDGRPISIAVFDEADRLDDAAKSVMGADLSLRTVQSLIQKVGDVHDLKMLNDPMDKLTEYIMALKTPQAGARVVSENETLLNLIDATLNAMRPVAKLWGETHGGLAPSKPSEIDALMAEFTDATNDLLRIRNSVQEDSNTAIVSWSPVMSYPSLSIGRINPGKVLSRLWALPKDDGSGEILPPQSYLEATLFTSATLAVPGKGMPEAFDDFSSSVGVLRRPSKINGESGSEPIHNVQIDLMHSFQPSKFGKMKFVLADPNVNNPTSSDFNEDDEQRTSNPEWLDYCATMIRSAKEAGGRTLVLTLSWRDTIELETRLTGMDGLIVHKRGDQLRSVLSKYKTNPSSVLLSPGAWEGVDLPGMVDQLVVTRIPFSPPDRADQEHERIHLAAKGYEEGKIRSILQSKDVISTRRKLEQGIGRGLRAPSDKVTLWIADPRFPLPDSFIDSLDPVVFRAPVRPVRAVMRFCIPRRFKDTTYQKSLICLKSGKLHKIV